MLLLASSPGLICVGQGYVLFANVPVITKRSRKLFISTPGMEWNTGLQKGIL